MNKISSVNDSIKSRIFFALWHVGKSSSGIIAFQFEWGGNRTEIEHFFMPTLSFDDDVRQVEHRILFFDDFQCDASTFHIDLCFNHVDSSTMEHSETSNRYITLWKHVSFVDYHRCILFGYVDLFDLWTNSFDSFISRLLVSIQRLSSLWRWLHILSYISSSIDLSFESNSQSNKSFSSIISILCRNFDRHLAVRFCRIITQFSYRRYWISSR